MKSVSFWITILCGLGTSGAAIARPDTISAAEKEAETARRRAFYAEPMERSVMDERAAKFRAKSGAPARPNSFLRSPDSIAEDRLIQQAQAKSLPRYQMQRCERFLKVQFPELQCDRPLSELDPASIERNDRIEELAKSWIVPTRSLDGIPAHGEVRTGYWSGDYWPMKRGLTSFRYAAGIVPATYREAAAAYRQPEAWSHLLLTFTPDKAAREILKWSPAEKYDLTVGDEGFGLTNEQKREGSRHLGADGDVESWFGLCHGWAPASVFAPVPKRAVKAIGARGVPVEWSVDDIKAMLTLQWSNGQFPHNLVGGRCTAKHPRRSESGRVIEQDCFDNNPATFHLALGNLIGRAGVAFIMDASYDYEVWNQPVVSYSIEYFNPLSPETTSRRWQDVAVDYDRAFKLHDRFQKPLTRGKRNGERYDDRQVRKIVGVSAAVDYLSESSAVSDDGDEEPNLIRVNYSYDLELEESNGQLIVEGGEWHQNAHPDFLWIPGRGAVAQTGYDYVRVPVGLDVQPAAALTDVAMRASERAYPLCQALKPLVERSSGASYPCADPR